MHGEGDSVLAAGLNWLLHLRCAGWEWVKYTHWHGASQLTPLPPPQVLYVKNLGPRVTMKDLVSLFARFQQDSTPIQFRLLSGRMRGQAFITFPGELCLLLVRLAPGCCRASVL